LFKVARVKTVVMPYGNDVQDFTKSDNLIFQNAMCSDYPKHHLNRRTIEGNVEMWTMHADHIIGGCDWVKYIYHWDTLTLAHFSIDTQRWQSTSLPDPLDLSRPFKIFHAPNHRSVKGTKHFVKAINELKEEGLNIELVIRQKVSNEEIFRTIEQVDVVADQLIVGWYAMFALEAMSMRKPVLCYQEQALIDLYTEAGLIEPGEIPLINCNPFNVKEVIRGLYTNRHTLKDIGERSREYVIKHHSVEFIGSVFHAINEKIGLAPRNNVS
jgi:glycosyltransferase involved in cell wall biosynthesis